MSLFQLFNLSCVCLVFVLCSLVLSSFVLCLSCVCLMLSCAIMSCLCLLNRFYIYVVPIQMGRFGWLAPALGMERVLKYCPDVHLA